MASPLRRSPVFLAVLGIGAACGAALGQTLRADAVDLSRRVLRTDREAFVVLPPRQVVPPKVTAVHFSPDKRSALVVRVNAGYGETLTAEQYAGLASPAGEISLYWWDTSKDVTREVWKDDSPAARISQVWWMPTSEDALFTTVKRIGTTQDARPEARVELWRVSVRTRKAEFVEGNDAFSTTNQPQYKLFSLFSVSPTMPLAFAERLTYEDGKTPGSMNPVGGQFELIGNSRRTTTVIALPPNASGPDFHWDVQGRPVVGIGQYDGPDSPGNWYAINSATGALSRLSGKPELYDERAVPVAIPPGPLELAKASLSNKSDGVELPTDLLWLQTRQGADRILIAHSHSDSWMLPGSRAAACISLDALWVTPIRRMTRDEEANLGGDADRARLVAEVKRAWNPLQMYARHHDDSYPAPTDAIGGITQYARMGLPEGLVYTYAGGSVGSIQDPSTTELAYLPGRNGRAVLFADGHAAWVNR